MHWDSLLECVLYFWTNRYSVIEQFSKCDYLIRQHGTRNTVWFVTFEWNRYSFVTVIHDEHAWTKLRCYGVVVCVCGVGKFDEADAWTYELWETKRCRFIVRISYRQIQNFHKLHGVGVEPCLRHLSQLRYRKLQVTPSICKPFQLHFHGSKFWECTWIVELL